MRRDDVIELLRANAEDLKGLGVTSLFLFGSTARDEARPDSDVDLFVDDDDRLDLFALAGLQRHLSELLGRKVDVGTRGGLDPRLREQIENESIRIF